MCGILVVFLLQLANVFSAPLNFQMLHPSQQKTAQPAQQILQQQLLELQQLQGLQHNIDLSTQLRIPPVIILLPRQAANSNGLTKIATDSKSSNKEIVDEDLDSITIEADHEETEEPQRVLLLPNYARLSIGDIISAIPFLPIEINVPDTIGWAYNGISSGIASIISIFGRRPASQTNPSEEVSLKSTLQLLQMKKQNSFTPILLMPIMPQFLPIQLPIQV